MTANGASLLDKERMKSDRKTEPKQRRKRNKETKHNLTIDIGSRLGAGYSAGLRAG
jgi:hypothetical protein